MDGLFFYVKDEGFDGKKEKPHRKVWLSIWQRMRDSNPRKRSQSPVCYRYTNPLCAEQFVLYAFLRKSQAFF